MLCRCYPIKNPRVGKRIGLSPFHTLRRDAFAQDGPIIRWRLQCRHWPHSENESETDGERCAEDPEVQHIPSLLTRQPLLLAIQRDSAPSILIVALNYLFVNRYQGDCSHPGKLYPLWDAKLSSRPIQQPKWDECSNWHSKWDRLWSD